MAINLRNLAIQTAATVKRTLAGGAEIDASARTCGPCRECCIILGVDEINKPQDTPCPHLCKAGCGIYGNHPQACRVYRCAWLYGELPKSWAPWRTHIVIELSTILTASGARGVRVLRAVVRRGHKPHRGTLRELLDASYSVSVLLSVDRMTRVITCGREVACYPSSGTIVYKTDGTFIHDAWQISGDSVTPAGTLP